MKIKKICVLGAGIMGSGIAQVIAEAGYEVCFRDIEESFVAGGTAAIRKNLDRKVSKEKITADQAAAVMSRIKGTTNLREAAVDADLVIEAVVEKIDLKREVFRELDIICRAETIFCSNTSGISITEMAAATRRPDRFIGMHFFNPVPVMKLVELTRGFLTSDETVAVTKPFVEKVGKTPIEVKEAPGFAVNRILCPMINEAIFVLAEGIASVEDIDKGMVLGSNHPIGPLALADMVGLDTLLFVMEGLQEELGEDKVPPGAPVAEDGACRSPGQEIGERFLRIFEMNRP